MPALPDPDACGAFGIYIHWPFCAAKCPYCDFNSHVASAIDMDRWTRAYSSEIQRIAAESPDRILRSVFFGGGTPSLMNPDLVASVLDEIRTQWRLSNDIEITLEANPTSVEADRFAGFRDAGVNRVSVGVQALNDSDLAKLGRLHSISEARSALDVAARIFDRVSFDLIYARQDQTLADWRRELSEALAMAQGHLSLYQLSIEPGTAFGDRFARNRLLGLPDDDASADMYLVTQELCDAAGLPAYEISNHARAGEESRHNLIYWRGGDYAGIGPGAHGRMKVAGTRIATSTPLSPQAWLDQVEVRGHGELPRQEISRMDQEVERIMMGLRLSEGIPLGPSSVVNINKINGLVDDGLIEHSAGNLRLTASGRPLLNAILREILV